MNRRIFAVSVCAAAALSITTPTAAEVPNAQSDVQSETSDTQGNPSAVAEIVVTAQRRAERQVGRAHLGDLGHRGWCKTIGDRE
jgi:hypothetical protein